MTKARIAELRLLVYEEPTPLKVLEEALDEIERLRRIVAAQVLERRTCGNVHDLAKVAPLLEGRMPSLLADAVRIAAEEEKA